MPAAQPHASSSVDMFVKIKGKHQGVIKGESLDHKHAGEIVAHSYSWDIMQPFSKSGSGLAAGKRQFGVFKFRMQTQTATPSILTAIATGEVLEVALTCRKAGTEQQEYITWKLGQAMITHVQTGFMVDGQLLPYDEVSLAFHKIEMIYRMQQADGTLGGGISFIDDWSI